VLGTHGGRMRYSGAAPGRFDEAPRKSSGDFTSDRPSAATEAAAEGWCARGGWDPEGTLSTHMGYSSTHWGYSA
jgi:hypothetical protein